MENTLNPFAVINLKLTQIENSIDKLNQALSKIRLDIARDEREPEFINAEEVSDIAKVKLTTIYAYNTRGTIPIYSTETPIIYRRDEIIEWLGNGKKLTPRLEQIMEKRRLIKK